MNSPKWRARFSTVETALALSERVFPAASAAVLPRSDTYADGLDRRAHAACRQALTACSARVAFNTCLEPDQQLLDEEAVVQQDDDLNGHEPLLICEFGVGDR